MPDVGVLNLQIQDNSAQAASGLNKLAAALVRVQKAVGSAVNLGNFTSKLAEFNAAVQKAIPEQTISSLERYAAALEKIKAVGGIKIEGAKSAADSASVQGTESSISNSIEQANVQAEELQTTMACVNEELNRTGTLTEAIQQATGGVSTASIIDDKDAVQETNDALERQVQIEEDIAQARSRAIDQSAEQARMERNYEGLRAAYLDDRRQWADLPNTYGFTPEAFEQGETYAQALEITMRSVNEYVDEFIQKMQTPTDTTLRDTIDQMLGIGRAAVETEESVQVLKDALLADEASSILPVGDSAGASAVADAYETVSEAAQGASQAVQDATMAMEESTVQASAGIEELGTSMSSGAQKTVIMTTRLEELDDELKRGLVSTENFSGAFAGLRSGISNLMSPFTSLFNQFTRLAKYRMLRAAIKQITSAFSEGIENYYRYSQAIGSTFATSMDSAATSLLTMKNSIAAAAAPIIQSLIPYLQQAVSTFITLINYVNQFISLIKGQTTWTKAVEATTTAYDDTKKKAKQASSTVKDLLADWDELNIIQSESSSSSGTGSNTDTTEYTKMFQEVSEYSKKIKALVNNIKEKFGSVLTLVEEIAAALLLWKVSEAFTGIVSTLSALAAGGLILYLTFKISEVLTGTYLDTGEEGWLIGDFLATAIGATLAKKVLTKVLGGSLAKISIPIAFALSAVASIKALLGDKDVSAMDERSIKTSILAALEMGTAAGYLAHLTGNALGPSILNGGAAALLTFGVAIGLKAIAETVDTGEITPEILQADILSAGAIGTGLAIKAAMDGYGLAGTLTLASGGALLTFGVLIGLESVLSVVDDGKITAETIAAQIGGSALIGSGLTVLTGGTLATLSGASLISFGLLVGLDGAAQVAVERKITSDILLDQLGASSLVGAGLMILTAAAGAGLAGVLAAGGGGALFAFGLLVTIDSIVANNLPKKVQWGNSDLTSEQVSSWVNEKMFKVDVKATVEKINLVVNDTEQMRKDIATDMGTVLTDLNVIKLGLASEDTYSSLKKSIFGDSEDGTGGVIGKLKTYAEQQKTVIKTGLTLMPIVGADGETDEKATAEAMKAGLTGWGEVESYMTKIGADLSAALTKGSKEGLSGYDDELIAELTDKLTNVQRAVTGAQLSSEATGNFMQSLSRKDAAAMIEEYAKYQKELEDSYNSLLTSEYESYTSLEAFYEARGQEGDAGKAAYYRGLANNLLNTWSKQLAAGVKSSEGPGKEALANALSELLMLSPEDLKANDALAESMKIAVQSAIGNSDMQYTDEVKQSFAGWLNAILESALTEEDYKVVSSALNSGLISYADLFSQDTIDALLSQWQGENNPYRSVLQQAWDDILQDALGGDTTLPETEITKPAEIVPELETEGADFGVETEDNLNLHGNLVIDEVDTENAKCTGHVITSADIVASAGASTNGLGRRRNATDQSSEAINVTMDSNTQKGNIRDGVIGGTNDILTALRSILTVANALNNKQWTINVNPSSGWGGMNAKSAGMRERVSGDYIPGGMG